MPEIFTCRAAACFGHNLGAIGDRARLSPCSAQDDSLKDFELAFIVIPILAPHLS